MRYWVFDGAQPRGPYEAEELQRQVGFTLETLICPEDAVSAEQWRPASSYLLRPPASAARQAPEPPAQPAPPEEPSAPAPAGESARMREGPMARPRIEKAKLGRPASDQPAPARKPAPVVAEPEPESAAPAPGGRRTLAALSAALLLGGSVAAWRLLRAPAAPRPAEAPLPMPEAASTALLDPNAEKALRLAQAFPLQSPSAPLPADAADVFSPKRWRAAATLGELYRLRGLQALGESAAETLRLRGQGPFDGEAELRKGTSRWQRRAERFLSQAYQVSWKAQPAPGGLYKVSATISRKGFEDQTRHFEVEPRARSLRPLDVHSWHDLDRRACARWADRYVHLGEDPDEPGVTPNAPAYQAPAGTGEPAAPAARKGAAARRAGPGSGPIEAHQDEDDYGSLDEPATPKPAPAVAAAAPKKAAPKPSLKAAPQAPKPVAREDEDYDSLDDAQSRPISTGIVPERQAPAPISTPAQAPARAAAPKPAAPAKPAADGPPPAGAPAGDNKAKSVSEMSVDELEQYLNRQK